MINNTGLTVLITGDRNWSDKKIIQTVLTDFQKVLEEDFSQVITKVINGGCRGADKISTKVCEEMKIPCHEFPANWSLGKSAGPIRNRQMLDEGNPAVVIAFHSDLSSSKGTKNMILQAKQRGLAVMLHDGVKLTEI